MMMAIVGYGLYKAGFSPFQIMMLLNSMQGGRRRRGYGGGFGGGGFGGGGFGGGGFGRRRYF